MSDSVQPHRQKPTRLPRPWDSPGKNTGVGCHFLLQCMEVKSEREVTQSCPTLSDPMDCSLLGSSIHGIFQERVLEWGAIAFSVVRSLGSRIWRKGMWSWGFRAEASVESKQRVRVSFDLRRVTVCHHLLDSELTGVNMQFTQLPVQAALLRSDCVCALNCSSCVQFCNPMDHSLPSSSVHGSFQGRILE